MARKGALNAENLALLGAERLSLLLMELADGDASIRKRLVLAVAEGGGAAGLIKAVDRRLSALATSRGYIDWEKSRAYAAELDGLRRAIAYTLTPLDAAAAAERLETFVRLTSAVLERVDDSNGRFGEIFHAAVADLAAAWGQAPTHEPMHLAQQVFSLILWDEYGVCDELIADAASALGDAGLTALAEFARAQLVAPSKAIKAANFDWRHHRLQRVLTQIADVQGDVDAFIAVEMAGDGANANVLGIARRLLDAERPEEALSWLDRKTRKPELRIMTYADLETSSGNPERLVGLQWERESLRIRGLEMLGRRPEAQEVRWRLFEQTLQPDLLRSYLKVLPDFEDDEALDRAYALASSHASALMGLGFLVAWPNLGLAANLVETRGEELDGRYYEHLGPSAEALAERYPYAATILYRRMIDSVLERGASKAYPHAAQNLKSCGHLAQHVDWSANQIKEHAEYVSALRRQHGRKTGFWSLVA